MSACVYAILSRDPERPYVYIGHSFSFSDRALIHASACNDLEHHDHHLREYQIIRANGSWQNFEIDVLETFPDIHTVDELLKVEQEWMDVVQPLYREYYMNSIRAVALCYDGMTKKQTYNYIAQNTPVQCECGAISNKKDYTRHKTTKGHKAAMAALTESSQSSTP